ncbi:ABC transporter ATP-binding protein [Hoeflea prorocentri]|uniref:ABC transporter ATP-binding protein n=1 Tax=Hoeflea prorocentri TaxID=1922333 RepID=A0A9X3UPW7_9HYPH|nr:ABC transporter ATP-binding protein [Hoeflea prorocentri]MCY6383031.1 ABC transporter ATP-binding protein [Hoeflea prorocentri]MDA5400831.1 ABC transporter ATP-binding protein [Hoeflea prorocentri]
MADLMPDQNTTEAPILEVSGLNVFFDTPHGKLHAVRDVSLDIRRGEALGVLGESGSGKSVSFNSIMGLLETPPATIQGNVRYGDIDLLNASAEVKRSVHGDRISMVFQDAITSLNPALTVGYQLAEMYRVHRPGTSRQDARKKAIELMEQVKIPAASQRVGYYPHEFSGGMCQRIMIALAIALEPDILIADEPTTALDVTVQGQIMQLLEELRAETNMAMVLITHDIGLVAENTDRLLVMYAGQIVESGPTTDIINGPMHYYTIGLMNSMPTADKKGQELGAIQGSPPVMSALPPGCAFAPRCVGKQQRCLTEVPQSMALPGNRSSACHFAEQLGGGA